MLFNFFCKNLLSPYIYSTNVILIYLIILSKNFCKKEVDYDIKYDDKGIAVNLPPFRSSETSGPNNLMKLLYLNHPESNIIL